MNLITRNKDILTGYDELESLHTFKNFPIFVGTTNQPKEKDVFIDMSWGISKNTGMIQLDKLIPLDILYENQHISGVGEVWRKHHEEFSKFILKYQPNSVFEIGAAHGYLCNEYQKRKKISWTIIEPNPVYDYACEAKFIEKFFDENFVYDGEIDTIVHSHVFEHIYEPDAFCGLLSKFLDDGKKLIFSIPNMKVMLENKYTNCLGFEHTYFLLEEYVQYLLTKHKFKLLEKQYFKQDHSIFYAFEKDSFVKDTQCVNLYSQNKKIYEDYINYHLDLVSDLNDKMKEHSDVFIFGAHIFTQALLSFGLNSDKIIKILDNDTKKQKSRLYGSDLFVESPKILSQYKNPVVILKAGAYTEEIKKDIVENINSQVIFL
jgi:hypothetical protein